MTTAAVNYVAAIFFVLIGLGTCIIPDYIHVCHHDDPQLGICVNNSIEELRPHLVTGIPQIKVPSLEPLSLDAISFNTSSESNRLSTNISNAQIWGASNFKILKLIPTLAPNKAKFEFEVIIPQLRLEGNYQIDTKILLLQLKGDGPFHANITDYHFNCILKGRKIEKDGVNHLEFNKMDCNGVVDKISINLENLFGGNSVLGKATNDAINENSGALFHEVRPGVVKAIRRKLLEIANRITASCTYEELFP